jgi:hypothetical protein
MAKALPLTGDDDMAFKQLSSEELDALTVKVWQIFTEHALQRKLVKVSELEKLTNMLFVPYLGVAVVRINLYCERHNLPPLTSILDYEGR